jgi:exosortase A
VRLVAEWRSPVARLLTSWLLLIALFRRDWFAMADQWWNSSTYNHVLLIPAIIAWLVWQRSAELVRIRPEGWLLGLGLFALAAVLWLLGQFAGLNLASQAGAVGMLIATALTILGPRAGAGLAFPLAYMAFLVPFGDELVAPLQMLTARMTIGLVHLSGIPAQIDGVFITTPAGLFEVAEACSGVKFLIAMIAFGILVCNVCFISWRRRAVFMLVAGFVPILANGIRAWGTIYVAQYTGADYASGFDHIVYGWLFFALVIAAVTGLAWRFFDRPADKPMIDADTINRSALLARLQSMRLGNLAAPVLLGVLAVGAQAWALAADSLSAPVPRQIFLPEVPGWHRVDYAPREPWAPHASGAAHRLLGRYADDKGHAVDVFVALYASQGEGREAGGFGEGALPSGSSWAWQSPGPAEEYARTDRLLGLYRTERLAVTYYRTGNLLTGSNAHLKLANMADRLLLRARPSMLLILSAEERPDNPGERSISAFRSAIGSVGSWMDGVAGLR